MTHYFETPTNPGRAERSVEMTLWGHDVTLTSARGVFSADGLDLGTAVLLRTLPPPTTTSRLLDLGCGIGPITLALALACPQAEVTAVDVNDLALDLTQRNATAAGVGDRVRASRPDDVDPDLRFDEIWSNPPIRIGKEALHQLLRTWLPRLTPGGIARLVVARNLGADSLASWLVSEGWQVVREGSAKGFRVLSVSA
ncbi:MAG TPA: methyltransferase [Propionibacteriaceae bacterium]|nr:methyltransferase [Propionibacteriaceae bacterium]